MFERFTDRARRVLLLAQEESSLLGHNYVGTEHLLLGLARQGDGVGATILRRHGFDADLARDQARRLVGEAWATGLHPGDAEVLRSIGIDLDEVRRRVEEAFGPGALERPRGRRRCHRPQTMGSPFTPRAKKSLELALREALALGHGYIGTEHVLLGLLREGEGLAARLLVDQGLDLAATRAAVLAAVGDGGARQGPPLAPRRRGRRVRRHLRHLRRLRPRRPGRAC